MNFTQQLLANIVCQYDVKISFPQLESGLERLTENRCLELLQNIHAILKDDCLNDAECFTKIEKIVCLFEESGVGCGSRHDFG